MVFIPLNTYLNTDLLLSEHESPGIMSSLLPTMGPFTQGDYWLFQIIAPCKKFCDQPLNEQMLISILPFNPNDWPV